MIYRTHSLTILIIALLSQAASAMDAIVKPLSSSSSFNNLFENITKYRQGLGANTGLYQEALIEKVPGGLQSLCHFTKKDTEICMIGCTGDTELSVTDNSPAEELAKALILPYLCRWSFLQEPVVVLVLSPHQQQSILLKSATILMAECQKNLNTSFLLMNSGPTKRKPAKTPEKHSVSLALAVHYAAEDVHKTNGTYAIDTLHFTFPNFIMKEVEEDPHLFTFANEMARFSIDIMSQLTKKQEKRLFARNGPFEKHIRAEKDAKIKLSEYHKQTDELIKNTEKILDAATSPKLQAAAKETLQFLTRTKEDIPSYFSTYVKNWENATIGTLMLNLYRSANNVLEAFDEFKKHFIAPAVHYSRLTRFACFLDLINRYKNIVIITDAVTEEDAAFLTSLGFEGDMHGIIYNPYELVTKQTSPFTPAKVKGFLNTIFRYNALKSTTEVSPLRKYTHYEGTLEECLPEPLTLGRCTLYVDPKTYRVKHTPFHDHSITTCLQCEASLPGSHALARYPKKKSLCSNACLRKYVVTTQAPELEKLLAIDTLDKEERAVLQHLATVCYLRFLSLAPSTNTAESAYFELNHPQISKQLTSLIKQAPDNPAWQRALSLAQALGIDIHQLHIFNEIYYRVKKKYLEELLKAAKQRKYSELSLDAVPDFDSLGRIKLLQTKQFINLRRQFGQLKSTPALSFPQFYGNLVKAIAEKVPFFPNLLEQELTVTPQEEGVFAPQPPATQAPTKEFYIEQIELPQMQEEPQKELPEETLPSVQPIQTIDIPCLFARRLPYTIRLFNPTPFVAHEDQTGKAKWAQCTAVQTSYRINTVTALAEVIEDTAEIVPTSYGSYMLNCTDTDYDISIRTKLDLHHLFPPIIDKYLRRYGIVEQVDDLIQLSLPGLIRYDDGTIEQGFFQTTFIPDKWICIHRCFKRYTCQESKYISPALSNVLERVTKPPKE